MLCTYCGATTPPTLDRCVVCHTPYPPGLVDTGATVGTNPDDEQTRLTPGSQERQPQPPVSAFGGVSGITRLEPGQTFANRYTIIRLLGAGGMAAVYQAWDETLATAVALKLIRVDPSMLLDDIRQLEERFKRELKLARQVTHPNVIRIHDLGEVGRTMYITMAYVQGSDLATVLQKERQLPVPRALSLARQIVSGLSAAHRAGVVHRDLKPANILVDASDQALLTDFGIARSKTGEQTMRTEGGIARLPPTSTLMTMPGAIMGTLEYMAPEQAHGEPADERTDIYAVGLILHELLAGPRERRPGEGIQDIVARIEQGPPPLETVVPDVPSEVARIVSKCLKRDPVERYATADELIADLDRIDAEGHLLPVVKRIPRWKVLTAAALVSAVLIAGTWWVASTPPPATARAPLPVLVVDFENRTGEPVFDGALEQPLTVAMEGAPFITAYPRTDAAKLVRQLKQDRLNENAGRLIAYGEGIRVILAGSIERAGRGYRISVRAIDPEKPETPLIVANERASDKAGVFAAIGKAAEDVRERLGDTAPASSQQQAETFTAASLEAIKEYTIAQTLSSSQDDEKAVTHYKAALQHDRDFGRAHAGLAMSLYYLGQREDAEKQWEEALRLKDRMSEREQWRTAGSYYAGPGRNPEKAIEEFTKLVDKYPADRAGQNNLAVAYFNALSFAKALEHGQKALDIYPKSVKFRSNFALYAMYAGDFTKAAETAQALTAEDSTIETAYLPLAMEALASGDPDRARRVYAEAAKAGAAGASLAAIGLADVAIYQGKFDEALAALPEAITRDLGQKDEYGATAKLLAQAEAHLARNQRGRAADALARARGLAQDDRVMVTAGRFAVAIGRVEEARAIATGLANRRPNQSRAYGKLIEADIEMAAKRYPAAIDDLNEAKKMMNLWLVRYALGHAYFQQGDYQAALSEFEECQRRRGEATALFLDDLPTFRYYATVPYWLGRTRERRSMDARTQYQEFLAIRGGAADDPLVIDARRRLGTAAPAPK